MKAAEMPSPYNQYFPAASGPVVVFWPETSDGSSRAAAPMKRLECMVGGGRRRLFGVMERYNEQQHVSLTGREERRKNGEKRAG